MQPLLAACCHSQPIARATGGGRALGGRSLPVFRYPQRHSRGRAARTRRYSAVLAVMASPPAAAPAADDDDDDDGEVGCSRRQCWSESLSGMLRPSHVIHGAGHNQEATS